MNKKKSESVQLYSRWDGDVERPVYDIYQELTRLKYDPLEAMVNLARKAESEQVRFNAASKIYDSVFPKKKSVDISSGSRTSLIFDLNVKDPESMKVSDVKKKTIRKNGKQFFKKELKRIDWYTQIL